MKKGLKTSLIGVFLFLILENSYSQNHNYCSTLIPEKITSFDTVGFRGLADNYYLWNNGQKISVKFLSGSSEIQKKIALIAKMWEDYANIHFVFVNTGSANIRIKLDLKGGDNSLIGTLANSVGQNQKTMNLDTSDFDDAAVMRRVVLHEFGHVLGLLHEHFNPTSGISWNKKKVYKDLYTSNGWDTTMVNSNIFEEYGISYTNGTLYDRKSIMHYPILASWTTNNYSVGWNNELSGGDKSLISALYPFYNKRKNEVPRFQINSIKQIEIINSRTKNGLLIYPKFSITTAGKEGMVYFVIFFYYSNGDPIKIEGSDYNIDHIASTFKVATIPANLQIQANNGKHDLELFIPYSVFPLPEGTNNIQAKFSAFLYDNNEIKLLSSSNAVNCVIIK
jgi:Astacin (Peptidase family M12A)